MPAAPLSGAERAIFGDRRPAQVRALLDRYAREQLASGIASVTFRAGRIDAVWGVELNNGDALAIKAHRQPVNLAARIASADAQRTLAAAGFPCPVPASGPDRFGDLVLSAETLVTRGSPPNGRDPKMRRLIAAALAEHVDLLRGHPDLIERAGRGPAWCRYQDGPWPRPHDPIFDFITTPPDLRWLDEFASAAAKQILDNRHGQPVLAGHGDWYAGNLLVDDGELTGSFDWDLTIDTEAVIAGYSAGCYPASATAGGGLPNPTEVVAFLQDYADLRRRPFTDAERRAAAGAAAWTLAYNARCELSLLNGRRPQPGSSPDLLLNDRDAYLDLDW